MKWAELSLSGIARYCRFSIDFEICLDFVASPHTCNDIRGHQKVVPP